MARLATASKLTVLQFPRVLGSAKVWLGTIVSLVCLWLAIRPVPFAVLAQVLASAHYVWLLPAIGLQLVAVVARARRWVILLRGEATLGDAFWALGFGYLFTNVFPLRLGE